MTTRRQFLAGSVGLGGAAALASALPGLSALAQSGGDYKALVCIFLRGGIDGHDTVIPLDLSSYDEWSGTRQLLLDRYEEIGDDSRTRGALRALGTADGDGRQFALPRQLSGLAELYDGGDLAVMANVGPLEAYMDKTAAAAGTAPLPPFLMSHNDQQAIWQTLMPEGSGLGWGGQFTDALIDNPGFFNAVAVGGPASFTAGQRTSPFMAGTDDIRAITGTSGPAYSGVKDITALLEEHFTASAVGMNNYLASDFANAKGRAVQATNELASLVAGTTVGEGAAIEGNSLSEALAVVAKIIGLRGALGVTRQVFCVQQDGYDTHEDQFTRLPLLQAELSEAMVAFQATMNAMGVADQVTAFTASDFGRTLQPNATGTDHGWGNHHFVMGGAVRGGSIYGAMAPHTLGHDHDFDRGRLIPTTSLEQFGGALGRWFGVSETDLDAIFPKRGRFDAPPALFG